MRTNKVGKNGFGNDPLRFPPTPHTPQPIQCIPRITLSASTKMSAMMSTLIVMVKQRSTESLCTTVFLSCLLGTTAGGSIGAGIGAGVGGGGGEEKELGVPGEKLKERVAGEGGGIRDEQEEQVVLGNSSASDGNALSPPGGRLRKRKESATTGC